MQSCIGCPVVGSVVVDLGAADVVSSWDDIGVGHGDTDICLCHCALVVENKDDVPVSDFPDVNFDVR